MGLTFRLGQVPLAIFTDTSNNVGIGGAANASFKLQVSGSVNLAGNVTTTGAQFVQNGFYLTNANAGATAGYTHMWGADDGIFFGLRNATGGAKFVFQSATSYNYTFPAATGTLALTSNLSAYLPLTGGTLTGALSGTSATFSAEVTSSGSQGRFGGWATGAGYQGNALEAGVSGGIATILGYNRTSGAYIPMLIGGNTNQTTTIGGNTIVLQNNGVTALTIASTGAATFSSSVSATQGTFTSNDTFAQDSSGQIVIRGASNTAKRLGIGFDTTNNYAYLQAIEAGVATRPLVLQPFGGNVGIGTTDTQGFRLAVDGPNVSQGDTTTTIRVFDTNSATTNSGGGISFAGYFSGTSSFVNTFSYIKGGKENSTAGDYAAYLSFGTRANGASPTERMRITSGGNVLIGGSTDNGYKLDVRGGQTIFNTANAAVVAMQRTSTDGQILQFYKDGTLVGSISTNSNSLPSDLNFKKNINNLELGLNLVKKLRSVSYNHKIDDDNAALSTGFIAQELEQSLTELGIEKNEYYILQHQTNEDKTQSEYWLDYTKMIPILVNAIQEQQVQIEELKALINK